jgi:hypothetical protein
MTKTGVLFWTVSPVTRAFWRTLKLAIRGPPKVPKPGSGRPPGWPKGGVCNYNLHSMIFDQTTVLGSLDVRGRFSRVKPCLEGGLEGGLGWGPGGPPNWLSGTPGYPREAPPRLIVYRSRIWDHFLKFQVIRKRTPIWVPD